MSKTPLTDDFYGIGIVDSEDQPDLKNASPPLSPELEKEEPASDSEEFLVEERPPAPRSLEQLIFGPPTSNDRTSIESRRDQSLKPVVRQHQNLQLPDGRDRKSRSSGAGTTSSRRKQEFSGTVMAMERIRKMLGNEFYDPDATPTTDQYLDETEWTVRDLTAPGLRQFQNYLREQDEKSALAAVKEMRAAEKQEKLKQIAEYDSDGSLMSLFRIWSLIPPVFKLNRDELAEMLARRVIYNKDDIIAINKPYGISTTRSITEGDRLSVSTALSKLRPMIAPNCEKLYVMHRLDKCTTGVLLLATSRLRATELRDMFNERKIQKKYWALVRNIPDPEEGIIDIPLIEEKVAGRFKTVPVIRPGQTVERFGRIPMERMDRGNMDRDTPVTEYKVTRTGRKCALVECTMKSGFTHQIRCHLGFGIGTPVIGDHKYSDYLEYLPQRLPPDMLHQLGIRSAKSRSMPMHLHARESDMGSRSVVAILAYADPSCWIAKLLVDKCAIVDLEFRLYKELYRLVRKFYEQMRVIRFRMDSYFFCALVNELRHSCAFRSGFIKERFRQRASAESVSSTEIVVVVARLKNPERFPLDYEWNYKVEALVNRHLELEKLMWLLSTLGGAFSALGDIAVEYAQRAGRISWEQLRIAFLLADPITVARCKLYIAISKIQTGQLRVAKRIIQDQYRFATSSSVADNRMLTNVCLGVWSKLKYAYEMRRLRKGLIDRTS